MPHHEGIVALAFGFQRIVDREDRAAKFRETTEVAIGRRGSANMDFRTRVGDLV